MPTLKWETAQHRGLKQDSLFPGTETCLTTLMTNDDKQDNIFATDCNINNFSALVGTVITIRAGGSWFEGRWEKEIFSLLQSV